MRFALDQKLLNSENNLYYHIGDDILYLSNTNQTIKQLTNINIKKLIKDDILSDLIFGGDTDLLINITFNTCLIDSEYINEKLKNNDILKLEQYLIEPNFYDNRCFNNIFEDGLPLDPVTMEPISEEDRINIDNACFSRSTIRDLIQRNILINPLTRQPLSKELLSEFNTREYLILNGIRYEIIDNKLDLYNTKITNLTTLQNLINLEILDLSYTNISNLTPLQNLTNLKNLNLSDTYITDITPLQNLTNLEVLYLSNTRIDNITPLQNLINLNYLYINGTNITDFSPLQNLVKLFIYS